MRERLTGLLAYPAYYAHMAPLNRRGPAILERLPALVALSPERVAQRLHAGAWLVNVRHRLLFAQAHVPGAVNSELDSVFSTYVGWVIPYNSPLILSDPPGAAAEQAVTQLIRIGYDRLEGYLADGVPAWQAEGRPVHAHPTVTVDDVCHAYLGGQAIQILDVRQPAAWGLPHRLHEVPTNTELWVACARGRRASLAASFLDRAGIVVRLVAQEGIPEWLARCFPQQWGH